MDVLALVPEPERREDFWIGRLSMAAAMAVRSESTRELRPTLAEFLRSPVCSEELHSKLREEMG